MFEWQSGFTDVKTTPGEAPVRGRTIRLASVPKLRVVMDCVSIHQMCGRREFRTDIRLMY